MALSFLSALRLQRNVNALPDRIELSSELPQSPILSVELREQNTLILLRIAV